MTIKYECDVCGTEVYEAEALGPGVFDTVGEQITMGKGYTYEDEVGVSLVIAMVGEGNEHFCLACMWKALERMMETYAPKVVEVDAISKFKPVGWAADGEIGAFSEETPDGSTDPDPQLHELYFEGILPTPGADEPADDPADGLDPLPEDVPNFDDSKRPGWTFHSTANGI